LMWQTMSDCMSLLHELITQPYPHQSCDKICRLWHKSFVHTCSLFYI